MSWENDESLIGSEKYAKIEVGDNKFKLLDDGTKSKSFDRYGVEFKVNDGAVLWIGQKPILRVLAEEKTKSGSLVNKTLKVTREGTGPEDTRYTEIQVE